MAVAEHQRADQDRAVVEYSLKAARRGRRPAEAVAAANSGKLPRVTRLMALAIKFDGLIRDGVVRDYADLARLGHVTRARMTQIMNMLNLAPDIPEEILFCGRCALGSTLLRIRPVAVAF